MLNKTSLDETLLMSEPSRFIHDLLIERKANNRSYSARALARDLGISQGFLSQVMSGKRKMSLEQKVNLASKLGLELNPQGTHATSQKFEVLQYTLEHEKILKHWYHFAILELTQTGKKIGSLSNNPSSIAKRLNISEFEAKTAIERLIEYGYLEMSKGKLIRTSAAFMIDAKKSSQTLREFHQSRLKAGMDELNYFEQSRVDQRYFQTMFIPTSRDKVQKAKNKIADFQKKLIEFLMEDQKENVFQLSLQLFSVDQTLIKNKTKNQK